MVDDTNARMGGLMLPEVKLCKQFPSYQGCAIKELAHEDCKCKA